ncbi:MAG: phytoene desaturase family protein [Balneolaceae bacterium]|nr:phytoene desaturase family protein [Balneolaceae bacterium]
MDIAIIGAGIGGLSASLLLSAEGHQVTVYEKNRSVGGKMNELRADGYRFDTGPSLLTMPELLEQVFSSCGEAMQDYMTLSPLDPLCRYHFPDGTLLDNYSDMERSLHEIRRIAPEDEQSYRRFLSYARSLFEKSAPSFLYNPLFDASDLQSVDFSDLLHIDALSTVSKRVDDYFDSTYLRRFFKRFTTYNGSSPFRAPATLNVIPHVEINRGGHYVKGGIYRIAEALYKAGLKCGVEFRLGTGVDQILTNGPRVTGIAPDNGLKVGYDLVISNSDAFHTYMNLLPERAVPTLQRKRLSRTEPSCSGFVLLLGIDRSYDLLKHHNVFFSADYRREFEMIFDERRPPDDPTIYVANTSFSDPSDAPDGGSNLFVLVNAPYLDGSFDWERNGTEYADSVERELENRGLDGLRSAVRFRQTITPRDFYERYLSNRGSIYGTSSNSRLSAFLRPANKARFIDGLYLVGGSTHPGGGIPLVILSAMHACELIKRYEQP